MPVLDNTGATINRPHSVPNGTALIAPTAGPSTGMDATATFVETTKNRVATFKTTVTVERTPATLSESRIRRARWFDYVADAVTECWKVKVTFKHLSTVTAEKTIDNLDSGWTDEYFEIVTPYGRGCVVLYADKRCDELECFIPTSGKALIFGCWKKYGKYRGHAVGYLRANKLSADSRSKVEHTCPAAIYKAAIGKKLGG